MDAQPCRQIALVFEAYPSIGLACECIECQQLNDPYFINVHVHTGVGKIQGLLNSDY